MSCFTRWSAASFALLVGLAATSPASAEPEVPSSADAPKSVEAPKSTSPTITEEQLLARWLRSSPEVASWRTQIGGARFDVVTARVLPNPELSLSGGANVWGTAVNGDSHYDAQLTVPLPVFGQVGARREAARALVSVAEATVAGQVWARAAEIQSAMVARAFADATLAMLQQNLRELDRIEGIVSRRAAAGANSTYDSLRVTTSTATLRGAVNEAIIERDRAEATILALVADPALTTAPITREGLKAFRGSDDEGQLIAGALERRPDLELARRGVNAAELAAKRWRRDAVPTPSLFVGGSRSRGPSGFDLSGGVSFPLPLFDRNQGAVGRSLSEAQGQELLARALETRVRQEVSGAWRARRNARIALEQFRDRSLQAVTELLARAEITYQAGKFSITELFDAYQTMWSARSQELDLERQMATAEADLERAAVLSPLPLLTR